jgi:hypothetical protein
VVSFGAVTNSAATAISTRRAEVTTARKNFSICANAGRAPSFQDERRALRVDQKNPDLGPISELIRNATHGRMLPVFNLDPVRRPLAIAGERIFLKKEREILAGGRPLSLCSKTGR